MYRLEYMFDVILLYMKRLSVELLNYC